MGAKIDSTGGKSSQHFDDLAAAVFSAKFRAVAAAVPAAFSSNVRRPQSRLARLAQI